MNEVMIDTAIERIRKAAALAQGKIFVGHSGGKDSCVVHDLCLKTLGEGNVVVVHNPKPMLGTSGNAWGALSEMYPETLNFLYTNVFKQHHVHVFPSFLMKPFILKNDIRCQVDGARASEHSREGKSTDFIRDGVNVSREFLVEYVEEGMFGLAISYPIFDWTDNDVFDYIALNKLGLSDEYINNGELMAWANRG